MNSRTLPLSLGLLLMLAILAACSSSPPTANTAATEVDGKTFLMRAVEADDLGRVERLVNEGAPLNAMAPQGTALYLAAAKGHDEMLWYLLRQGAHVNRGMPNGRTPLMVASENGHTRIVQMLLRAGADLERKGVDGTTALAAAALQGQLAMSKRLINAGADVNTVIDGQSLLMRVVAMDSLLIAGMLVDAGADVEYVDSNGTNALDLALANENQSITLLLQQAGSRRDR